MIAEEANLNLVDFFISLDESPQQALRAALNINSPAPKTQIVANDKLRVRLHFCRASGGVLSEVSYPVGTVVSIGAIPASSTYGTSELFIAGACSLVETETSAYYELEVNAATSTMATLLSAASSRDIIVNVQVSDALGGLATQRRTVAYFTAAALKDALNDGGAAPTPSPEYLGIDGTINCGGAAGDATSFSSAGSTSTTGSSSSSNTSASTSVSGTFTTTAATNTYSTTYPA